jgi:Zn-dependent alcohol dehydrogenase
MTEFNAPLSVEEVTPFEVAGVETTLTAAYEMTRRGGTMVMVAIQTTASFSWTPFDAA